MSRLMKCSLPLLFLILLVAGTVFAQPQPPAGLTGRVEESGEAVSVLLSWEAVPGTVIRYNVYRRPPGDGQPVLIGAFEKAACADYAIERGLVYRYTVTAVGEGLHESPPSEEFAIEVRTKGEAASVSFDFLMAGERNPALVPWAKERREAAFGRCRDDGGNWRDSLPCLLLAGESELLTGNVTAARERFERTETENPGFLWTWEQGLAMILAGDNEEARRILEPATDRWGSSGEMALLYGMALRSEGRLDHTAEHLMKARDAFPTDYWPSVLLPMVLAGIPDTHRAEEVLKDLAEKQSREVAPKYERALLLEFLQSVGKAKEGYREILDLLPDEKIATRALADLEGEYAVESGDTLKFFEDKAETAPDAPQSWFHLGMARWMSGNQEGAQEAFEHGLELDRAADDPRLPLVLAWIEAAAGRVEKAESILENGLTSSAGSYLLRRAKADLLLGRGAWEKAAAIYLVLSQTWGAATTDHLLYGLSTSLAGSPDLGLEPIRKYAKNNPDAYWPQVVLGNFLLASGDTASAADAFEKAVQSVPKGWLAAYNLAWTLAQSDKLNRAEEILKSLADSYPDDWLSLYNRGVFLQKLGRAEEAMTAYRSSLEKAPGQPDALSNLGALEALSGKVEEAADHLRKAHELDGGHLAAAVNLGLSYFREKKYREAETVWAAAVAKHPHEKLIRQLLAAALKESGPKP